MADDASKPLGQDEIEQMLSQAKGVGKPSAPKTAPPAQARDEAGAATHDTPRAAAKGDGEAPSGTKSRAATKLGAAPTGDSEVAAGDIELLLRHAEEALASVDHPHADEPAGVRPFKLQDFAGAPPSSEATTLELIRDVDLDVKIELGRTHMFLEDVLRLRKGSVVPLDKLAGDPVDIIVNGRLVARGEVLVLNDNFCVRVAELVAGETTVVK